MNRDWAEKNDRMQALIGKEASFREGIDVLLDLREELFGQITSIVDTCPEEAFCQMPFARAKGNHNNTLVYSMWHVFRIEDIVAHTLIRQDAQLLFTDDWLARTESPVITTGNELRGDEIAAFSKRLNARAVYEYCAAVKGETDRLLRGLEYSDLRRKFTDADKQRLKDSRCVSADEEAAWLIDYWCGKDVRGLIRMPFSRHWIMHVEAMCKIYDKLRMAAGDHKRPSDGDRTEG